MKNILQDQRFFYQPAHIPWWLRLGIWLAALVFTVLTASIIPLSDLLEPHSKRILDLRPVDTVAWHPKPPPPPLPRARPKPPPPARSEPKPLISEPKPKPVQPEKPKPLRLPVKFDFSLAAPTADFSLDFEVDPTVTEVPEVVESEPEPPPPAPPEKDRYELDELDRAPIIQEQIRPVYPYRARTRGIQGYVDVEFTVKSDGSTSEMVVRKAEPPAVFDSAACQAVSRWRFAPGIRQGKPVASRMKIRIRFTLD